MKIKVAFQLASALVNTQEEIEHRIPVIREMKTTFLSLFLFFGKKCFRDFVKCSRFTQRSTNSSFFIDTRYWIFSHISRNWYKVKVDERYIFALLEEIIESISSQLYAICSQTDHSYLEFEMKEKDCFIRDSILTKNIFIVLGISLKKKIFNFFFTFPTFEPTLFLRYLHWSTIKKELDDWMARTFC